MQNRKWNLLEELWKAHRTNGRLRNWARTRGVVGGVQGTRKSGCLAWVPWIFRLPVMLLKIQIPDWGRAEWKWASKLSLSTYPSLSGWRWQWLTVPFRVKSKYFPWLQCPGELGLSYPLALPPVFSYLALFHHTHIFAACANIWVMLLLFSLLFLLVFVCLVPHSFQISAQMSL